MDILGALGAAWGWFVTNLPAIEALAKRLAEDVAAVYVLALGLAAVLAPYFPKADSAKAKLLGVLKK